MAEVLRLITRYWGKAGREPVGMPTWHPLLLHCLDVAAVADCLMTVRPRWLARVAEALRLTPEHARLLLLWLIALHDLGKFAGNFQVRVAELAALLGVSPRDYGSSVRHDAVGLAMASELLDVLHERTVGRASSVLDARDLLLLLSATTGHHGAPRTTCGVHARECWNASQLADAFTFAESMWTFFGADAIATVPAAAIDGSEFSAASWDIAGLTIVADWLGSNTDWFPYASTSAAQAGARCVPTSEDGLRGYWRDAQQRAAAAVDASGLCRAEPSPFDAYHVVDRVYTLRPAQHATADLALPVGGSLTILEDQTGSGKTEAALLLLHRLMAEAFVDGAFLALPTQATANALYERALRVLPALVRDPARASAVLSHSARDYNRVFRRGLMPPSRTEFAPPGEQEPATVGYAAWLAESNKRALLAQFGVGTIDQSLLSVLRSKHQALRLFGLDDKLLLVDEVHAYDSYQAQVLKTLLTRIASRGGHVVLLSATLPKAQRQQFVDAFARGLRQRGSLSRGVVLARDDYPLLTRIDCTGLAEVAVDAQSRPHAYRIRYVSDVDAVIDHVVVAAEAGRAVAWIRNTVNEARDAYARLHARLSPPVREKLELFHARFALGDRTRIEDGVRKHFGAESKAADRAGRVLVATQVIEQSLDVDFDIMVTDLAPIDLLIQRAGRLHRHHRDAAGNRTTDGVDGRGEPELIVYGPRRADDVDADWVSAWSRGTALVYDNHAYLWRTARELGERLDLGAAPRAAIEAVYDARDDDYPKALQRSAFKAESNDIGDRQMAGFNTIRDDAAYENDGVAWPDDMTAPTRLGEPTIELVLARVNEGRIAPWSDDPEDGWAMSVVRVRRGALRGRAQLDALEAAATQLETSVAALRWRTLFILFESGECYEGRMVAAAGSMVRLTYDPRTGLGTPQPDTGDRV